MENRKIERLLKDSNSNKLATINDYIFQVGEKKKNKDPENTGYIK